MKTKRCWLLTPEKIVALEGFVADRPGERTPRLLAELPAEIHMEEMLYYLKSS